MKKFTLFVASLFITIGAMAQFETGKEYRIKEVSSGKYLNAANHDTHETGATGGVNVIALNESSNEMIFTAEASGDGFKLKTKSGYYIKGHQWNVDAYSTTDGSVLLFEASGDNYIIKWVSTATQHLGQTKYFKVEDVGGTLYPFCDAAESAAATWVIEEYVAPEGVYETEEVKIPTDDGVYRVYWKQNNRGYLAYHDSYPTKGVLADVTLSGYASRHFNSSTDPVELEWYLITSDGGNKYLFNVSNGKFLTYSNESVDGVKVAYFDAARPCPITIVENTSYTDYAIIKATVDGTECLLSSGCGNYSTTGYPIRWNSKITQDMGDGGSPLIFVKVIDFPVDEAILTQAEAAINDYENPVEDNVTFQWTASTTWAAAEDLTSTVLNDNQLANGIKYIEGEVTVAGARTATVTFDYTSGGHKLNVRGVEVIDANGNIVAGDYAAKSSGDDDANNPVYTVKVAEAGTYTVRCYATDGGGDNFSNSNGTITVAFAKLNVIDLTKEVTFTADYATLHLGYSVAVPAGVEAYVVSATNATWATLEQVNNVIPAATPVILKKTGTATSYNFYYTSDEADEIETNLLEGSIADRYVAADAYVLGINNEEVGLYTATKNQLTNTAFKNNANKAYLPKTAGMNAASYSFRFGEGTTGIDQITENREQSTAIFDLTGRRVEAISAPGIYIVGGRKVLVK